MKKAVIGGFLSLVGSIWALVVVTIASQDLVSGWPNPPGRFLTTVLERDLMQEGSLLIRHDPQKVRAVVEEILRMQ